MGDQPVLCCEPGSELRQQPEGTDEEEKNIDGEEKKNEECPYL